MLRNSKDIRSLIFMCICTALLFSLWLIEFPLYLDVLLYFFLILFTITIMVVTHNHQHLSIWKNKNLNLITDCWLTVLFGFPVFSWIPTHNSNHHVYVNGEQDRIRTYRYLKGDNLITLFLYPTWIASAQVRYIFNFYFKQRKSNRKSFRKYTLQFVMLFLWISIGFAIDWQKALVLIIIPQQIGQYFIFMFNYIQHVNTDQTSKFDHSRNFTGDVVNFIFLNNGYHTVHHFNAGAHWSTLKEKHDEIAEKVHPSLNISNFATFFIYNYFISLFSNHFGTTREMIVRNAQ